MCIALCGLQGLRFRKHFYERDQSYNIPLKWVFIPDITDDQLTNKTLHDKQLSKQVRAWSWGHQQGLIEALQAPGHPMATLPQWVIWREFPGGLVVKDSGLSLLWYRLNPQSWNFHMPCGQPKKRGEKRSSRRGLAVTNPTRIHEDAGSIPGLAQWVKDSRHCHELWCRSQTAAWPPSRLSPQDCLAQLQTKSHQAENTVKITGQSLPSDKPPKSCIQMFTRGCCWGPALPVHW